jgi:hypothetical protein
MTAYKLRKYDVDTGKFNIVVMDFESIIQTPWQLHSIDIVYALLGELRKERGLEPLPKNSIVEENGEQNG